MSNKSCPLCNRPIEDENNFCPDCRDRADHESLSLSVDKKEELAEEEKVIENTKELLDDNESFEADTREIVQPKKPKSSKKLIIFVVVGSLFVLIMGLVGGSYVRSLKQSETAELNYWEHCVEVNTPLEYSKYLLRFPEGKYQQEAEKRIIDLRKQEYNDWLAVKNTYDMAKYTAFLASYPETPHKAEVLHIGDSISWVEAELANTPEAYDAYLRNTALGNINGDFRTLAQERYDYVSQLKPVEGDELEAVKVSLDEFFDELSSSDLKKLEEKLLPTVSNFYGLENVSASDIKKAILAELKTNKIQNFTYKPDFTNLSLIKDNQNIYFAEFDLDRTIVYDKKRQETSQKTVVMELTPEKKVKSLRDKK